MNVTLREPFAPVILRSEATKDLPQDELRDRRLSGFGWAPEKALRGDSSSRSIGTQNDNGKMEQVFRPVRTFTCRRGSLCKLIFAFEALYPAGGIHYLLFAGEEWMALAT